MLVYNSPVVLTFTLLAGAVLAADTFLGGWLTPLFFSSKGFFNPFSPFSYLGLFTHIIGHENWAYLSGNFILILMVGPLLEEKYGSKKIFLMIMITAFVTGISHMVFFSTGVFGASGIVFMMLILASFVNVERRQIPITFILAVTLFIGQEVLSSFKPDNISQFGHILGGACGGFFGMCSAPRNGSEI